MSGHVSKAIDQQLIKWRIEGIRNMIKIMDNASDKLNNPRRSLSPGYKLTLTAQKKGAQEQIERLLGELPKETADKLRREHHLLF